MNTENQTPAPLVTFKGFDKELKCRDFAFEIGKEYENEHGAKACEYGFHACEYPLDVFTYYPPTSRFATVEQSGVISRHDGDSKVASSKIKIVAEIGLAELIKAAIDYTVAKATPEGATTVDQGVASSTGYYGVASSTGYYGAASSTGYQGAASSTGYQGAASSTGYQGAASSTGYRGVASSTGNQGAASSTGYQGAASSTGYRGVASSTGDYGAASSTGYYGAASSTGYQGAASSTGDYGAASSTGKYSVAMASGYAGKAKGAIGCALFIVHRNAEQQIIKAAAAIVGQDGIKPDVWYMLTESGEFTEAIPE